MYRFEKIPAFAVLIFCAAFGAAVFGALMSQLSYSVGPTYFTDLKFAEFGVAQENAPRVGAAIVGAEEAWWTGILIVLPAFVVGLLRVPRTQSFFAAGFGAIGLAICIATFTALLGLITGLAADSTGLLDAWLTIPEGPTRSDYLHAGLMHDGAFLGGLIAAIAAFVPMRHARRTDLARSRAASSAPAT